VNIECKDETIERSGDQLVHLTMTPRHQS
jgi:hypothetical protein